MRLYIVYLSTLLILIEICFTECFLQQPSSRYISKQLSLAERYKTQLNARVAKKEDEQQKAGKVEEMVVRSAIFYFGDCYYLGINIAMYIYIIYICIILF